MQRRDAEIGPGDRNGYQRQTGKNKMGWNPHRTGLFYVGLEMCGLSGLDGGRDRDRTCDPLDVNEVLSR
jgi:hypothetical protein